MSLLRAWECHLKLCVSQGNHNPVPNKSDCWVFFWVWEWCLFVFHAHKPWKGTQTLEPWNLLLGCTANHKDGSWSNAERICHMPGTLEAVQEDIRSINDWLQSSKTTFRITGHVLWDWSFGNQKRGESPSSKNITRQRFFLVFFWRYYLGIIVEYSFWYGNILQKPSAPASIKKSLMDSDHVHGYLSTLRLRMILLGKGLDMNPGSKHSIVVYNSGIAYL